MVGETRVRGLYSRNAANGTLRAAPEATSFWPGSGLDSGDLELFGHVRTLGHLRPFRDGVGDVRAFVTFVLAIFLRRALLASFANTISAMSLLLGTRGLVVALSIFHATA